jgi:hypothetical protein
MESTYKPGKRTQNRPKSDLPDVDWARLAAFVDGEGHIRITSQKRKNRKGVERDYMYVELSISNADPRLMTWLTERFGGNVYRGKAPVANVRKHSIFQWHAGCSVAHEILLGCLPYFVIKRNQAEIAISFRELTQCKPESGKKRWGVYGMPDELKEIQYSLRKELQETRTLHFETEAVN